MKFNHTTKHQYSIRVKKHFLVKNKPLSSAVFCKHYISMDITNQESDMHKENNIKKSNVIQ